MFEELIRKAALENALKFKGKANPKAIIGTIIRQQPSAKGMMKELQITIQTIVQEVNELSQEQQHEELLKHNPDFHKEKAQQKQKRKKQRSSLPDLPDAQEGKVVTRIPPEPSKYNHLGHAMSFLINYLYAKKYHGKAILRFDDTNPEKSKEEYVQAVHEDVLSFLDISVEEIKFASDNMDTYYQYAQQLLQKEQAYVCSCNQEDIKKNRREQQDCKHRSQSVQENLSLWEKMKQGTLEEGSHVLRLKIDMNHKNAVMRDPVIYRLSYTPHYRVGTRYKVWPMYDFETAIEEGRCGVTHVLRSNEFDQRIELQHYIASLFNFPLVTYKHYGRYNIVGASTQGREIRSLIKSGKYLGWDDPRLVTIRALRRRGIVKEAFYELAQRIGLSKTQTNLDFSQLAAVNRGILDASAKRLFALRNPVRVTVHNIPSDMKEFSLAYHPQAQKGERTLPVTSSYFIEKEDYDRLKTNDIVRFKDAMNLKKTAEFTFSFSSQSYEEFKKSPHTQGIIHFLPDDNSLCKASVLMPDVSSQEILCESHVSDCQVGEVIQFERWAFCRLDKKKDGALSFYYTHD